MSAARLTAKIQELMNLHKTSWHGGTPYVDADGSFGVLCGTVKGGLYSAYFLIDKLAQAGLFAGSENPEQSLDDAVYKMTQGNPMQVYAEAQVSWNENNEIQTRIRTDKLEVKILAALAGAIEIVKEELRQKRKKEDEYAAWREADQKREEMPAIVSPRCSSGCSISRRIMPRSMRWCARRC